MAVEIEQQNIDYKDNDNDTFTCERCSHYAVCMLRMNISEFMELHFSGEKPFEVSELAKICRSYYPELKLIFEK